MCVYGNNHKHNGCPWYAKSGDTQRQRQRQETGDRCAVHSGREDEWGSASRPACAADAVFWADGADQSPAACVDGTTAGGGVLSTPTAAAPRQCWQCVKPPGACYQTQTAAAAAASTGGCFVGEEEEEGVGEMMR